MNRIVRTSDHDRAAAARSRGSVAPGGTTEMMGASGDDTGSLKRDSETGRDAYQLSRSTAMPIRLTFITPLLGGVAVAAAIAAAPIATAAAPAPGPAPVQQSCSASGSGTICQSPGNAQINDAPPPVQFFPYGGSAGLI
jgi:hypothetical protein